MTSPVSLVAGGTGLVGSYIIDSLSKKSGTQLILARSFDVDVPHNAKLQIINFDDLKLKKIKLESRIDNVYLCLGKRLATYELLYMQDSSKESFKMIDFDYSLSIAKLAFEAGAKNIAVVSAVGAQEGSSNYYFHIKGKLENSLKSIGYKNICFARPGHLLGDREEFRGYEIPILESALSLAAPFMQGPLMNFRQIEAAKVAEKMVKIITEKEGLSILSYSDFIKRE